MQVNLPQSSSELILHKVLVMRKPECGVQPDAHIGCRDLNRPAAICSGFIYHSPEQLTGYALTSVPLVRKHT